MPFKAPSNVMDTLLYLSDSFNELYHVTELLTEQLHVLASLFISNFLLQHIVLTTNVRHQTQHT